MYPAAVIQYSQHNQLHAQHLNTYATGQLTSAGRNPQAQAVQDALGRAAFGEKFQAAHNVPRLGVMASQPLRVRVFPSEIASANPQPQQGRVSTALSSCCNLLCGRGGND